MCLSFDGEIVGAPNMVAYSAGKTRLNGFTRTCALEMAAPFNVCVNAILTGKIYDPITLSDSKRPSKLRNIALSGSFLPMILSIWLIFDL